MNNIGITDNLDRARIKKLLTIGLFASIMTGIIIGTWITLKIWRLTS